MNGQVLRMDISGTLVPLNDDEIAQRRKDADAAANAASSVPQQVPMWAAQAALKDPKVDKYDAINKAMVGDPTASPPVPSMVVSNPPVYFAWTMGNFASRHSAFIATLANQFGMKDADIDAVFVAADKIAQTAG